MRQVELEIDVSDALGDGVGAGGAVRVSASVVLPEPDALPDRAVVCIALPSSSYARGYYTCDLPGPGGGTGGQAAWHAARGWIVVALDWPGCGAEAARIDVEALDYRALATACHAAQAEVLLRLANGVLLRGYPPVGNPFVLGLGAALGGSVVIYQQARRRSFNAFAVLGFSAIHSHPATPPGGEPVTAAWFPRDATLADCAEPLNAAALAASPLRSGHEAWDALAWGYHYDDVPDTVVEADLAHYARIAQGAAAASSPPVPVPPSPPVLPPWYARRTPERAARSTLTPGIVATEAACVAVPVLVAVGERDIVPDPAGEPRAYLSAPRVEVYLCPRMGHVHNMAGTRALLWERIDAFAAQCLADDDPGRAAVRP